MTIEPRAARHAIQYLQDAMAYSHMSATDALAATVMNINVPCRAVGVARDAIKRFSMLPTTAQVLASAIGYLEARS